MPKKIISIPVIAGALLLAAIVSGCATTRTEMTPAAENLKEVDSNTARAHCRMLGMARAEMHGLVAESKEQALAELSRQVRNQAAAMGATHILWRNRGKVGTVWVAKGRAYKCPEDI